MDEEKQKQLVRLVEQMIKMQQQLYQKDLLHIVSTLQTAGSILVGKKDD